MDISKFFYHRHVQLGVAVIGVLLIGTVALAWQAAAPSLGPANNGAQSNVQPDALRVETANVLGLGEGSGGQNLQGQGITTVQAPNTLQTQPAPSPQTAGGVPAAGN